MSTTILPPGGGWVPIPNEESAKANGKAHDSDWRAHLISGRPTKDGVGAPRPLLANAVTAFREAPEFAGALSFNEFSLTTVIRKALPWGAKVGAEWTDHEDRLAADWLQHHGIFVSVDVTGQAVQTVAQDIPFHPVREYLFSLEWDGTKRIDDWLNLHLGVQPPTDYSQAVGARWLISAVARILEPGCKADCCLILEGPQGIKKSTALKTLAEPWFTDEIADLGSKDAALQTRGTWVIEIAELDSMTRADVGKIKAFMSRATDRFRPPYGRRLIESPRQCVFAGSVNHSSYLRDETGGRRFWPVTCTNIFIGELAKHRHQLWAEAVTCYRARRPWWLDTPELNRAAEEQQAERYEGDAWDSLILDWAAGRIAGGSSSVSIAEALQLCLEKKKDQWTRADEMRVGRCLRAARWERYRDRQMGMEWRYKPPVPTLGGNISAGRNTAND